MIEASFNLWDCADVLMKSVSFFCEIILGNGGKAN